MDLKGRTLHDKRHTRQNQQKMISKIELPNYLRTNDHETTSKFKDDTSIDITHEYEALTDQTTAIQTVSHLGHNKFVPNMETNT